MGTERWPPGSPVRVLLIDDDRDDYLLTKDLFAAIPGGRFRLDHAPNYEIGLAAICKGDYDVYLLDYRLGSRTGLELLREYRTRLIADVVTGKLDVDDVELPALDEIEAPEDWETDEDNEADEMDEMEGVTA